MPAGPLISEGWKKVMTNYPDRALVTALLGICKFGARIGYEGLRTKPTIYPNLQTAQANSHLLSSDIAAEQKMNRLKIYATTEQLPNHYTASPLGLIDKSDGSKRRIHHLSYPTSGMESINGGIPECYGTIAYSSVSEAIEAIQAFGQNCVLLKRDFESAFRHIPVSPLDIPLLGFHWQDSYYAEQFLPFGLRTAPYLFNLFAEAFH